MIEPAGRLRDPGRFRFLLDPQVSHIRVAPSVRLGQCTGAAADFQYDLSINGYQSKQVGVDPVVVVGHGLCLVAVASVESQERSAPPRQPILSRDYLRIVAETDSSKGSRNRNSSSSRAGRTSILDVRQRPGVSLSDRIDFGGRGSSILPGPVFNFEFFATARRGRFYVVRALCAAVLLIMLWGIYSAWSSAFEGNELPASMVKWFAVSAFGGITIGWEVLVAWVIADERKRKTLDYLWRPRRLGAVLGLLVLAGVGLESLHPLSLPALVLALLVDGWFAAAIGVWGSIHLRSTWRPVPDDRRPAAGERFGPGDSQVAHASRICSAIVAGIHFLRSGQADYESRHRASALPHQLAAVLGDLGSR